MPYEKLQNKIDHYYHNFRLFTMSFSNVINTIWYRCHITWVTKRSKIINSRAVDMLRWNLKEEHLGLGWSGNATYKPATWRLTFFYGVALTRWLMLILLMAISNTICQIILNFLSSLITDRGSGYSMSLRLVSIICSDVIPFSINNILLISSCV